MTLDRRDVMKLGTALTVGSLMPGLAGAQDDTAFETRFQEVLEQLRAALSARGYAEEPALPLATGTATNGGLRHDFDQSALPEGAFVVQPLARVGDVAERARPDILPLFHEVGCHQPAGAEQGAQMVDLVAILTEDFGLDPARLAFVSVPQSEPMAPVLDGLGLPYAEKVLLRDAEEAMAARDASGFFFPDPDGDSYFVTMGVYYRLDDGDEPAPAAYPPPPNWTEIGEVLVSGNTAPLGMSFGAERLTLAVADAFPSWEARLAPLFELAESQADGGAVPEGLAQFR